jgi:catechol 2,3-dioxygenase-like lactoylglutathione lyase family enzyme
MIIGTRHTGLVVKDISVSIEFYEKLGLQVWKREHEAGDFLSQVVGLHNAEIETAKLKVADGSLLELLEYKSHLAKPTAPIYPSNKHGCSHVAFTVEDVEEISFKILQLGGSIVNPPVVSVNGLVKVMYCHDLDGILIELVQELEF